LPPAWITDPADRHGLGPYESFDRELAEATGREVEQQFLAQRGARRP
jgi:hypothetical protein